LEIENESVVYAGMRNEIVIVIVWKNLVFRNVLLHADVGKPLEENEIGVLFSVPVVVNGSSYDFYYDSYSSSFSF
jgi:uncharacterized GH25 family protein